MYDDDAEKKEARLYWLSPKGIRSCQDFIGPLRRHAVNYMSDAVFSDTVCTSALLEGLQYVRDNNVSLEDPASWSLATTKKLTLEAPDNFADTGVVRA